MFGKEIKTEEECFTLRKIAKTGILITRIRMGNVIHDKRGK